MKCRPCLTLVALVVTSPTVAGEPVPAGWTTVSPREVRERYPQAWACAKPCSPNKLIDVLQEAVEHSRSNG